MAQAQCPASCGEFIQGWIDGGEKLVSCPVDWFSTVEVRAGRPAATERPMMRVALNRVLAHYGYPATLGRALRLRFDSTIPLAKGMASSTADIAAAAQATARHLGRELSESELSAICVALEPTDSTIFRRLSLFDHRRGETRIPCPPQPPLDILLLESPQTLLTADYHRYDRRDALLREADRLELAWRKLRQACERSSPELLGEAATLSAVASQRILPKPGFQRVLEVVERFALYGVNVAHSGSVMGVLLDRRRHDAEKVAAALQQGEGRRLWPRLHLLPVIAGGVR